MAVERSGQRLEEGKHHSNLQEGQEGQPKELQVDQLTLITPSLKDDGADNPGNCFQAHEGQAGHEEPSVWLRQAEVMLAQLKEPLR